MEATVSEPGLAQTLTAKDFTSDQEVRWCPGCGDYSILKQVQTVLPTLGIPRENFVLISGIGCSSRFPYYMDIYGMHSIHGRAPAIASGVKASRPELSVWIVSGDGDALSIGGNHLIHILRRNFDVNFMLFNNQIYGLTKGQYSPTSEPNKITKSTPFGSIDHPFNPAALALGADGSFVARSMDRDPKHLQAMLKRSHAHRGTSFLEIYQNCNIFNDGAFEIYTDKGTKAEETVFLEEGKPLIFGSKKDRGIRLDGLKPTVVNLEDGQFSIDDLWIHEEQDFYKAQMLTRFFDHPSGDQHLPRPFGVFYEAIRPTYEAVMAEQLEHAKAKKPADLDALLAGRETWVIAE